jgi:hypothetical protein
LANHHHMTDTHVLGLTAIASATWLGCVAPAGALSGAGLHSRTLHHH